MIIDDMEENRHLLKDIFSTFKSNTLCVSSGPEALKCLTHYSPDIICLDIIMPGMDGYVTAEHIKEMGVTCPIIAISALKDFRDNNNFHLFDAWLPKPFTIDQIFEILSTNSTDSFRPISNSLATYCDHLDDLSRDALLSAIDKGALSQCEKIITALPMSECKNLLEEKISIMDFETIRSFIISA